MSTVGEVALWLAFLGVAWSTGAYIARWRAAAEDGPPGAAAVLVIAGALLVFSWGILGGALLRGDVGLAITREGAPSATARWGALAALWSTRRGAILTLALLLGLGAIAVATGRERRALTVRLTGAMAALTTLVVAVAVLAAPPFASAARTPLPGSVPLHLVHWAAAIAPLFALGTVAAALMLAALAWTAAGSNAPDADRLFRRWTMVAWLLATVALAAEQQAREAIGITAQEAVALGSSRSGLLLWLALAALLHRRVRGAIIRGSGVSSPRGLGRGWHAHAAHVGAAFVIASFALHVAANRVSLTLPPGETVTATDVFGRSWRFVQQGVSRFDEASYDIMALAVEVTDPGGDARLLSPSWRAYRTPLGEPVGAPLAMRAGWRALLQDVRVVLAQATNGEAAQVRVSFIPLAVLWPVGIALMVIGGVAALARTAPGGEPVT